MRARTLIALLTPALLLLGLAWLATPALAAPPEKIEICHIPPDNPDNVQTITVRGDRAVAHHIDKHGDFEVTENPEVTCDDGLDNDCDGTTDLDDTDCVPEFCNNSIDDNENGSTDEAGCILAVAYIDRNDNEVFDPPADGLIAKLEDTDGSGAPSVTDTVTRDEYPGSLFDTTAAGTFGVASSVCTGTLPPLPTRAACDHADGTISQFMVSPTLENFEDVAAVGAFVTLGDGSDAGGDFLRVDTSHPWMPTIAVPVVVVAQPGDQNFLDVDLFLP